MDEIKDGGPAFPISLPGWGDNGATGMSLRDYFAAKALDGMLAHSTRYHPRPGRSGDWHAAIAEEAYEIADAMIFARGQS